MFHIYPPLLWIYGDLADSSYALFPALMQTYACTNADLWQTFRGMNLSHLPIHSVHETDFEHVTHIHLIVLTVVQMCRTSCAIHIHVIVCAVVQTYQTSCAIQTHLIVFAAVQMCQTFHVPCLCSLLYSSGRLFT